MSSQHLNYITVSGILLEALNDNRLSWKAKGIIVYLGESECLEERLSNIGAFSDQDGHDSTRSGLKELEKFGYLAKLGYSGSLTKSNPEKTIRDRLQNQLGGLIEVSTPVGRIDLLTDTEIIEIKPTKTWKAAMGQVLAYGAFYPNHQKRIHLFGSKRHINSSEPLIREMLADLSVFVTFEEVN